MAIYCGATLSGLESSRCQRSKGGIVEVFIANYADGIFTTSVDEDTNLVTNVTNLDSGTTWYRYALSKNIPSTFTQTLNVEGASNYVSSELVLNFPKMQTANRLEVSALAVADTAVIVKTANGDYMAMSVTTPIVASAGSGDAGEERNSNNYYSITLSGEDDTFAPFLTEQAITTLLAHIGNE